MATKKNEAIPSGFPQGIGAPATRALQGAGFTQLSELTKVTEAQLMALHGFGPKALRILKAALEEQGLAFAEPAVAQKPKKRSE
jgi:predicted flap endonuclease-1-like 5' DNA nuclease